MWPQRAGPQPSCDAAAGAFSFLLLHQSPPPPLSDSSLNSGHAVLDLHGATSPPPHPGLPSHQGRGS
ncbi:hypothetical protein GUJ93_ZPchr0006g44484 [Zizania palustris]|uniref:Uncharacterized protein n=1 Tax=Zizania palustris TaxID=103762 RepID=A0A8J5VWB4_ZIZPA|nr:hypothetical protein GUJ93_ZPchr0006g44484 [Zizania palustris]